MKHFIIIPAAGSGLRFGSNIPKQFTLLEGKPVLMHTMDRFSFSTDNIILVINPDDIELWKKLCIDFSFDVPHTIVEGGKTRIDSVKNGLAILPDEGVVAIHDAVRPLVSRELIQKLFAIAMEKGNAVPAVFVSDSLRKIVKENNYSVDRKEYMMVQTPQCFQLNKLKRAYDNLGSKEFTDDASVFESSGEKINLTEGEASNIKITVASDLMVAEAIIKSRG